MTELGGVYFSDEEHADVENRGGFGKVYVYYRDSYNDLEATLLWGDRHVTTAGLIRPPREAINRGIRALKESPWGAIAFPDLMEYTAEDDNDKEHT